MQFHDDYSFLVIHRATEARHRSLRIVDSQDDALNNWTSSSRISPVFRIQGLGIESPGLFAFSGTRSVILIGPIHPDNIIHLLGKHSRIWLSLGLLNVVIDSPDDTEVEGFLSYAQSQKVPFEKWNVNNGLIHEVTHWHPTSDHHTVIKQVAALNNRTNADELKEAIQEYRPLMASAISRSSPMGEDIAAELTAVHKMVAVITTSIEGNQSTSARYVALGQLLTITSGLSRFASETFGGTPPIFENECQFWSHSLLGIGVATLALRNIRRFLDRTLGESRIPERFALLGQATTGFNDMSLHDPPARDLMSSVSLDAPLETVTPLLVFFSARDGYRSTETTVSAPLAAVSSCNSLRWSLLTITHEICHVIIRAIQSDLYPDLSDPSSIAASLLLINSKEQLPTQLEDIRRAMLRSIIKMDDAAHTRDTKRINVQQLTSILLRWRQEVDEIMVHTFDFLYFYGKDVGRYMSGIWGSWGTIPNISARVGDYVIRSICAVLSTHLRRKESAVDFAKDQVLASLQQIDATVCGGRYVKEAIECINSKWDSELRDHVRARRQLVKIVVDFLFSESIATLVRGEPEISSGASEKEGYTLRQNHIEQKLIRNPLRFLEIYTQATTPNTVASAWMLYTLAFCVKQDG